MVIYSHEIKRRLLFGRKVMINLDSILRSRNITLPTKVCLVKAMLFSVVMYGCESWTVKKAEHQRIYAFELWCWRRLLRVPCTARRSNQSILKEISPGCSLELRAGSLSAAKRSYPTSKVRGSGLECQAVSAQEWRRGTTLHLRSVAAAGRS